MPTTRLVEAGMTPTEMIEIQTGAAVVQALAAVGFLLTTVYNIYWHIRSREQERRDVIIQRLRTEFIATSGGHPTEVAGWDTPRLIEFFNKRLKELGEPWTYPFPRLRWW
jgi:hypothetical protein